MFLIKRLYHGSQAEASPKPGSTPAGRDFPDKLVLEQLISRSKTLEERVGWWSNIIRYAEDTESSSETSSDSDDEAPAAAARPFINGVALPIGGDRVDFVDAPNKIDAREPANGISEEDEDHESNTSETDNDDEADEADESNSISRGGDNEHSNPASVVTYDDSDSLLDSWDSDSVEELDCEGPRIEELKDEDLKEKSKGKSSEESEKESEEESEDDLENDSEEESEQGSKREPSLAWAADFDRLNDLEEDGSSGSDFGESNSPDTLDRWGATLCSTEDADVDTDSSEGQRQKPAASHAHNWDSDASVELLELEDFTADKDSSDEESTQKSFSRSRDSSSGDSARRSPPPCYEAANRLDDYCCRSSKSSKEKSNSDEEEPEEEDARLCVAFYDDDLYEEAEHEHVARAEKIRAKHLKYIETGEELLLELVQEGRRHKRFRWADEYDQDRRSEVKKQRFSDQHHLFD